MAIKSNIGFLGAGKMATALAKGFVRAEIVFPKEIIASDAGTNIARNIFAKQTGAKTTASNSDVLKFANVLILATKPDQVPTALAEISGAFTKNHLLISIAAGVTISKLENLLPAGARVIRVMPNTPALVGEAASAFALGKSATAADGEMAKKLLSAVGVALQVKENLLDAVTGLSGSGPAYVYQFIEDVERRWKVAAGLHPRDIADEARRAFTVLGAAKMVLETDQQHPGALKDQSLQAPAARRVEGLHALEKAEAPRHRDETPSALRRRNRKS